MKTIARLKESGTHQEIEDRLWAIVSNEELAEDTFTQ